MKKFRIEYIISIVIIIAMVLVVVFGMQKKDMTKKEFHSKNLTTPVAQAESDKPSESPKAAAPKATAAPKASAKPSNNAVSKAAPDSIDTDDYTTCTLSVSCASILDNMNKLSPEKASIIPDDGIVLPETEVKFSDGESAFDVLERELKKNNIHMEFEKSAAYNTVYIEGIANIYQFDCGELSGWTYSVNNKFPNYGCSDYKVKSGDDLKFLYTCDMGADIGADYAAQ